MDRLRVWMETRQYPMPGLDEGYSSKSPPLGFFRPPPLRTSNTYDDDDAFNKVALSLLSRYGALDLCVNEVLHSTLLSSQDRASFLDGMMHRKNRLASFSPSTASLIQDVDRIFGQELKRIVEAEQVTLHRQNHQNLTSSWSSNSSRGSFWSNNSTHLKGTDGFSSSSGGVGANHKLKSRRFFPESGDTSSAFFRSRKIQNIDWKIVEMAQQVQSLQLDGGSAISSSHNNDYEPPVHTTQPNNGE